MKNCIFALICLILLYSASGQTPPSWGGNPRYTVKVKLLNNQPVATWNFMYYYDSTKKVERYEHEAQ